MVLSFAITESDSGRTVGSILRHELSVSASLLRRMKTTNAIMVNGTRVFTNYAVSPGEIVTADTLCAEPPCGNLPEHGDLTVLYENAGLLAAYKPQGMLIHPSHSKNSGTLANFVAGYLLRTEGSPVCHAVNRLDRDTSGVVLFAKCGHMKARASLSLARAEKVYYALVYGQTPPSGVINAPIRRLEERNMLRAVLTDGQHAVTHYETLETFYTRTGDKISMLRLFLETGRTHQIRAHCLHAGHPILGDALYATEHSRNISRELCIPAQALHARRLTFIDPLSGELVKVEAPLPHIMANLPFLDKL